MTLSPTTSLPEDVEDAWLDWRSWLKAPSLATDVHKLVLALAGVVLTWLGWAALEAVFPGARGSSPDWFAALPPSRVGLAQEPISVAAKTFVDPLRIPGLPLVALFTPNPGRAGYVHAALALLWAMTVWGIVGGAIARIALARIATGGRVGALGGLRFAAARAVPLILAPIVPLVSALGLGMLAGLVGALDRLPGRFGSILAGALGFVPILLAVPMTWLLVWLVAGWPLMVSALMVEDEDAFDALSRSHGYVFHRAWSFLGQVATGAVVGAFGYALALLFARALLHLAAWGLALGASEGVAQRYLSGPVFDGPLEESLHSGWIALVSLLAYGWGFSYFWSAAARLYLLMRRDVDGAPTDMIARRDPVARTEGSGGG